MTTPPRARSLLVGLLLLPVLATVAGCATDGRQGLGDDPSDPGRGGPPVPTSVPAATGPVATRPPTAALVLDDGSGAVACLGPVAESFPPQCGGDGTLPLADWSWAQVAGTFEQGPPGAGPPVRFGDYALSGRFDGTTLTVTDAVPVALYDTVVPSDPSLPRPETSYDARELAGLLRDVEDLPGFLTAEAGDGQVLVGVLHDDGTLQAWADQRYGAGVVVLRSALVPR